MLLSACLSACGRTSLQRCILFPVRLCSGVHQAGRGAAGGCWGLIECWLRPAGTQHSGFLNHSTNAFIHLQNSAINFGAGVRTFGEIWPVIASLSRARSFSPAPLRTGPDRHSKQISRLILYSYSQLGNTGWSLLLLLFFLFFYMLCLISAVM